MAKSVGFIGLGSMGAPMAKNLVTTGFDVRVFNRTREKAQALAAAGARVVSWPAGAAEPGGIVVIMVANDAPWRRWSRARTALPRASAPAT